MSLAQQAVVMKSHPESGTTFFSEKETDRIACVCYIKSRAD